jgi:hypothetical protein
MSKFKRGVSGNPSGRPAGIADRRGRARELIDARKEELISKAIDLALGGDTAALKLCLERICAPIKAVDIPVLLENLPDSLSARGDFMLAQIAAGSITPDEGAQLMSSLAQQARITQVSELQKRLELLERAVDRRRD